MHSLYNLEEGAPDDRRDRDQENEVRHILRRRQRNTNHPVYGLVAAILGGTALLVWGFIYSDALHDGRDPLTQGYAAFLAFAIVVGFAATAAAATWMIVRDSRERGAEEDMIREHRQQQQLVAIRDAIAVFLREGDESALKVMAQTRHLLDTGTDSGTDPGMGTVHRFRGRG